MSDKENLPETPPAEQPAEQPAAVATETAPVAPVVEQKKKPGADAVIVMVLLGLVIALFSFGVGWAARGAVLRFQMQRAGAYSQQLGGQQGYGRGRGLGGYGQGHSGYGYPGQGYGGQGYGGQSYVNPGGPMMRRGWSGQSPNTPPSLNTTVPAQ